MAPLSSTSLRAPTVYLRSATPHLTPSRAMFFGLASERWTWVALINPPPAGNPLSLVANASYRYITQLTVPFIERFLPPPLRTCRTLASTLKKAVNVNETLMGRRAVNGKVYTVQAGHKSSHNTSGHGKTFSVTWSPASALRMRSMELTRKRWRTH